jgi:hypothetical protein
MKYRLAVIAAIPILALTALQTPPRLRGAVDLTIGGEDADPPYSFGNVSSLALGADGRIYVADSQDEQIRVYSDAGKFLFAIGRKGSGPGEFSGLASIAFAPDGSLWAREEVNFRYQSFTVSDREAKFRGTVRMLQPSRGAQTPLIFDMASNIIEVGHVNLPNVSPYRIVRSTIGSDSRVIRADTIQEPPADSLGVHLVRFERPDANGDKVSGTMYFYEPFPAVPLIVHAANGEMARAVSSSYAVLWTTLGGQRKYLLRRDVIGPEPSKVERDFSQQRHQSQVARAKTVQATLPTFRTPTRKPPVEALYFSAEGELWVERSVTLGQNHEADIYDRTGRFVAIAEWDGLPFPTSSSAIRGRTVITIARDSNDVQRVVRLRFK